MRSATTALRRHWFLWALFLTALVAFGLHLWSQVRPLLRVKYNDVSYIVPSAQKLVAGPGETVYRIDPTQSVATYGVDEKIAGATADHATGSTNGIAGDVALNAASPSSSRVGEVVVDLEELHSNNSLRDARIRAAFLDSHTYPLARFVTSGLSGLPASLQEGQRYTFTMSGNLTVKTTIAPVTWAVQASVANGQLQATATTTITQSEFRIGPISVAGLVSTSDKVTLTLKLVALDPIRYKIPTSISAPAAAKYTGTGPSFAKSIQPVLAANCASCHAAGQVGAAHWQLATAGDAASIADGIRTVTQARFMPPWPASGVGVALLHSKALDQKTINLIAEWADTGGKLDEAASTPIRPTPGSGGPHPRQDLVLHGAKAYTGTLSVTNDYRCFVLDPHFTQPTFMTGYTFLADQVAEIHHAQVFHIPAANADRVEALDGTQDGRPGWQCYGGPPGVVSAGSGHSRRVFTGEAGLIAGWAPGQDPVIYPDNSGVLFQPGDLLVLQIHYHFDRPPTPDRSGLALQVDPGTSGVRPLQIINPLAPVEIPCLPGTQAALCDRSASLQNSLATYGPTGMVEGGLLLLCGQTPQQLTAGFDGIAHSSCDTHVPESGTIISVMGHMHTLGRSIRLTLDPGAPAQQVLLDIPTWNFDWQMNYALAKPIHVKAGETVRMECTWDRSLDPTRPPKYITFAPGTEDEMCFSTYALIPDARS